MEHADGGADGDQILCEITIKEMLECIVIEDFIQSIEIDSFHSIGERKNVKIDGMTYSVRFPSFLMLIFSIVSTRLPSFV